MRWIESFLSELKMVDKGLVVEFKEFGLSKVMV